MTSEINDKLLGLAIFCSEKQIGIQFSQYGNRKNIIEDTIVGGVRVVQIEIGNPNDENLLSQLTTFHKKLKESLSVLP